MIHTILDTNAYWQHMIVGTWNMFGDRVDVKNLEIVKLPKKPLTLEAMVIDHNLKYITLVSSREQTKAQKQLYKLIELLESNPLRLKEDPASYVSTINNLVGYLMFQKKDEEVYSLLAKAKKVYNTFSLKTENRSLLKQIMRSYSLELELYRNSDIKDNSTLQFVATTEQFLEKNKNKLPKSYLLSLWFQLAYIWFVKDDFDAAQKWLNKLLNTKFDDIRVDLQIQARMLNLIIHFEQGNYFVLRHFVGATRRFLKKVKGVEEFEKILLGFFTKLSTAPKYEYKEMFQVLYERLFLAEDYALVSDTILDYIDYESWIRKRI